MNQSSPVTCEVVLRITLGAGDAKEISRAEAEALYAELGRALGKGPALLPGWPPHVPLQPGPIPNPDPIPVPLVLPPLRPWISSEVPPPRWTATDRTDDPEKFR